jgi:hypothetical protein
MLKRSFEAILAPAAIGMNALPIGGSIARRAMLCRLDAVDKLALLHFARRYSQRSSLRLDF